ncbi:hypothetical protein BJ165DRAFT_1532213 [Panaeolus papilionaceus]|nr:hypothetical protein BJ165DRAFT_1532213 [Panaeolus papilionaceus]
MSPPYEASSTSRDQVKMTDQIFRIQGLDAHTDIPVVISHVVLPGFVKYFWCDVITNQLKDKQKKDLLVTRLLSLDVSGLGISPLQSKTRIVTRVQYSGSLVIVQSISSALDQLLFSPLKLSSLSMQSFAPRVSIPIDKLHHTYCHSVSAGYLVMLWLTTDKLRTWNFRQIAKIGFKQAWRFSARASKVAQSPVPSTLYGSDLGIEGVARDAQFRRPRAKFSTVPSLELRHDIGPSYQPMQLEFSVASQFLGSEPGAKGVDLLTGLRCILVHSTYIYMAREGVASYPLARLPSPRARLQSSEESIVVDGEPASDSKDVADVLKPHHCPSCSPISASPTCLTDPGPISMSSYSPNRSSRTSTDLAN